MPQILVITQSADPSFAVCVLSTVPHGLLSGGQGHAYCRRPSRVAGLQGGLHHLAGRLHRVARRPVPLRRCDTAPSPDQRSTRPQTWRAGSLAEPAAAWRAALPHTRRAEHDVFVRGVEYIRTPLPVRGRGATRAKQAASSPACRPPPSAPRARLLGGLAQAITGTTCPRRRPTWRASW